MPAVARINGGWFDDERTRDLAKTVIYLSLATATVYIVDTAVEVADPFTRNRFDEEYYYNLTGTEVVYVAGAAAFYTSVAVGLLCVLLIPDFLLLFWCLHLLHVLQRFDTSVMG
uniref:Uncharacterized protein n=1 Tax=Aplanochytrium stocchinoi TaxID=215587 RepID=A0A7S3LL30_9STRA